MRDFKQEIDETSDFQVLREILSELAADIEALEDSPYEEASLFERIHDLELILRYGEHKLEKLLA
ncbi:MAG: hypothetical protein ABI835_06980 [Chloroflexota bacterium]